MKRAMALFGLVVVCVFALASKASSQRAPDKAREVLVGRISHVEGELLHYVPDADDWIAVGVDSPFGLDDALYSGEDGRAEFILPNQTRIRIGGTTQIQLITLKERLTQVDVASGVARFYNNSSQGSIKATTPFGYVVAQEGAAFDLYVGDASVEVVPVRGVVDFVLEKDRTKYEVGADPPSIVSNGSSVTPGEGTVDADWDAWNEERDRIWAQRVQVKGDSVRYLPEGLRDESHALDEHGQWEQVEYEGQTRTLWRPSNVDPDWEPYTAGRWATYHRDSAWIPEEPFGYVTHHYGNWVYAPSPGGWYWAPPVAQVVAGAAALAIGFSWYPGRVGWIHSGPRLGWFPLAPHEPYYAHRYWGPRTVVVRDVRRARFRLDRYRYLDRAVVIDRDNFYRVNNYRNARIRNLNRADIVRNYRTTPYITNRVIPNYGRMRERYNYRNVDVARVPHRATLDRIQRNRRTAARAGAVRDATVQRDLRRARQGRLARNVAVERPKVSNRLVPRNEARRARSQVRFQQRELKQQERRIDRAVERQGQRNVRPQRAGERVRQPERRQERQRMQTLQQRQRIQRQQRQQRLQRPQGQERLQRQQRTERQQRQQRRQSLQRQQRQQRLQQQQNRERRELQQRRQRAQQREIRERRARQQRLQQDRQRRQQLQRQRQQRQQRLQRERQQQRRQQLQRQQRARDRQRIQQERGRQPRQMRQQQMRRIQQGAADLKLIVLVGATNGQWLLVTIPMDKTRGAWKTPWPAVRDAV